MQGRALNAGCGLPIAIVFGILGAIIGKVILMDQLELEPL